MFKKIDENLIIRSANESDYANISSLANKRFGKGYMDFAEYKNWLQTPDLLLVAESSSVFAGFICLKPETPEEIADSMGLDVSSVAEFAKDKPIARCKSCALVEAYEKQGIMKELLGAVLENAKKLGFGSAYAPAWMYNGFGAERAPSWMKIGFCPMENNMKLFQFERIAVIKDLWYNDEDYTCVLCGGKCHCDAVIYRKAL